jgi:Leucine-rich repeat (LRR) protein
MRDKIEDDKHVKGYTEYQRKVIKNFYENKDLRLIQKLGELVSNLYVETSEKKKESGWKRIKKMLVDLKVHPHEVEYLTKDKNLSMISKKLSEMF